jgi:hypothetical protein
MARDGQPIPGIPIEQLQEVLATQPVIEQGQGHADLHPIGHHGKAFAASPTVARTA